MFSVDFATSHLQLVAYPKVGRIGAYKSKTVKVVMTCFVAGEYMVEMWVKTEPLQSVLIKAIFMKPYLSALHPLTTGDFTLIDFAPTLEQTVRRETLIIRNVSSRTSSFTVLAEVGTTEIMTLERARESDVNFTYFSIDPVEGKMGPFEGRLFTASFHPTIIHNEKGWKHKGDTNTKEYLAFLRLIRVEVVDTEKEGPKTEKDGAQSTLTDDSLETPVKLFGEPTSNSGTIRHQHDQIILRLCLHGLAMKPLLEIVPDLLTFDVDVGSVATKVLSFKNITPSIVLGYKVIKTPFVDVIPPMRLLQPMQRVEALVRLKAFSLGSQNTLLTIEIVAPKEVSRANNNKKIGSIDIKIKIKVRSKTKEPKPRFNTGITPKEFVHEVGINIDRMTFRSTLEGEKAPIFLPKPTTSSKRSWLSSRYTIAVPNDRGLSLATRPYDKNMITPFTGKKRYIPPVDSKYAYTEEAAQAKKQHDDKYRKFMLKLGHDRRTALIDREAFVNEYDYKLDRRLFDKMHMYDDVEDVTFDNVFKDTVKYSDLCPLSPLSLFNIKVHPKNLDFGLVPPGVDVTNYITVENKNKFQVAVKLITQKVGIIIPEPAFRVKANTSVTKPVMIHLKNSGKFFSNLNYIINTHHMFDLKITAEAIRRTLELSQTVISFPKPSHEEIFQLRCVPINIVNPLSVPTSFYWKLPPLTAFKVLPIQGTIGGLHSINCTLYYEMNTRHFASTTINLVVVKGPTIAVQCNAPEDASKLSLFNAKVYCPSISLGLPFEEEVLLFNPNHRDAVFFLQNTNPIEGVNIRPACGIIKARACYVLTLVFNMNRVTMFDFRVNIDVNAKTLLYFKVNGFVIYPKVNFSPQLIAFKVIPCYSYETASVEMQNDSDAPAIVSFAMEDAYQMKISLTKHVREPGLLSEGISIPPNSAQKIYLHFLPRELSSYMFYLPAIVNNIVGPPSTKDEKSLLTQTYLKPGDKCQGNKCDLLNIPESLSVVKIDCTTVNPLITFSHFELNFVKKGNIRELQVLKVKNQLNCMMKLWFDYEQIFKSPFQIMKNNKSVKVLKLHPLEEIVLHTYFCPSKPGTYIADLPVYISSKKNAVFYNIIRFTGIYHKSSLYCSEQVIYFLPVPLNIEVERSISVIANHQQKKTELMYSKFVISGEFVDDNIWCDFPKGTKIIPGIENFTVPVTVKFCSNKPLSAIVALKFSDGYDGICKVGVCFTAENCRLTTYAFSFLSSLPPEAADVTPAVDLSDTSVVSEEKDSPHSESDIESSSRRVDSTAKRTSKKNHTQPSLEEKSSSVESKQLRGSLMDQISDAIKRKASLQNKTRSSNDSFLEKGSKQSFGRSDTLEPEDDNLEEVNGSEDLKGQYLRVLVEVEQYPLFPCDVSDTMYAEYMRREEEFVEQWLYEQGFQCSFRMHIGEDIFNTKSFQKCLVSRSKSYQSNIRSLLDLVLKLSGRELEMVYAASSPLPEDDRERVIYCLKTYHQIILFLKRQGALMEHVFPFYLLDYEDYLIYYQEIKKSNVLLYSPEELEIKSDRVMFDKERYERLGHQCWLDLFLQLFKVLLLLPIQSLLATPPNLFDSRISALYNLDKSDSKSEDLRAKYEIRSSILLMNVNAENMYYSVNEIILLNWMNHLFELKRNKWNAKDKLLCVPPRKITNFTEDLKDGVVLTAVTTHYCPYLIQEFQNFYYKPITKAEYLHNAQLLTLVWWNIRLGLVITPLHFQRTDQITMTFIVTHLYYSLRSYVPRSSLKLTASLSSTMIRKLSLTNPSDSKIRFILYKIGDINDCFEITKPHTITIASKQKISLVISYFAKRLFKVK
uniref:Putative calponin similarity domain-containing protein 2 isoform 1 n=1 Tax=Panstrongylus lignarius TaxID=156445 RepID=A0A224XHC8_9HEMI